MARDLGGRTSSEEEGQARQSLELFRSPSGFVSKPRTRALFSVEVRCIANGRARQECTSLFFVCLVASSMVYGSGAKSIHARHGKHATVQRRSWTLMNSLACFFTVTSSGKQHAGRQAHLRESLPVAICQITDASVLSRPRSQRMTNENCLGGKDDNCLCVVTCGKKTRMTQKKPG